MTPFKWQSYRSDSGGGTTSWHFVKRKWAFRVLERAQNFPEALSGVASSGNLSQQILISRMCARRIYRHGAHVQMNHRLFLSVPRFHRAGTLINSIPTP